MKPASPVTSSCSSIVTPVKPNVYPKVCPAALQVAWYAAFSSRSMVRAQPSTAMSCVAQRKFIAKKRSVSGRMAGFWP